MVQAILEGRKKMTRRTKGLELINANPDEWTLTRANKNICRFYSGEENNPNPIDKYWIFEHCISFQQIDVKCSFGVVRDIKDKSDILWVRESFAASPFDEHVFVYKAAAFEHINTPNKHKYKPSIHMPKLACRIFLKVTDVRCERLHEVTEQDAVDEGILDIWASSNDGTHAYKNYMHTRKEAMEPCGHWNVVADNAIYSFRSLWAEPYEHSSRDSLP